MSPTPDRSMRLLQRDLHQNVRAEAIATRERIATLVLPLDQATLNAHPEPNGWSIGQVLEHLCLADELAQPRVAAAMEGARSDPDARMRAWKPSFIGGRIAAALGNPKPRHAPKVFQPGPTPRAGIVDALLTREANFVLLMDAAASLDWRALRFGLAALPSWAPKLNLGDGFRIHAVHLTRHAHQIERLAARL